MMSVPSMEEPSLDARPTKPHMFMSQASFNY